MFLQVQVPKRDKSCLRFLWRPTMNEPVQIYEYQRHVFRAKISPTCANYALKRVAINNDDEFTIPANTIQNNFYMAISTSQSKHLKKQSRFSNNCNLFFQKHGFEQNKWITNSDVVTNAILEDLRSISNTKQVKVEPRKVHPCLGFSGRLSMIVYRFVEVQAKKLRPQSPKGRSYL